MRSRCCSGHPPADWSQPDLELADIRLPRELPVSVPSQLVHRRPDILAAEAQLHAATAAVGVATANLYPQIALTATLGQQALTPAKLFDASSDGLVADRRPDAAALRRRHAARRAAGALDALHASAARYQQVVLDSFGQVADLLDALDHDAQLVAAQANARDTSEASLGARAAELPGRQFRPAAGARCATPAPAGAAGLPRGSVAPVSRHDPAASRGRRQPAHLRADALTAGRCAGSCR